MERCRPAIEEIEALGDDCIVDDREGMFNVVVDASGSRLVQIMAELRRIVGKYALSNDFIVTFRDSGGEPGVDVMLREANDQWKALGVREAISLFGPFKLGIFVEDTPRGLQSMMNEAIANGMTALGILIAPNGVSAEWQYMLQDPYIVVLQSTEQYHQLLEQLRDLLSRGGVEEEEEYEG